MKKRLMLTFLSSVTFLAAQAQEAANVHKTVLTKFTADWCGPCGSWGWDQMEQIIDNKASLKLIPFAFHYDSDNAALNLTQAYGQPLGNALGLNDVDGIPSFSVGSHCLNQASYGEVSSEAATQTTPAAVANAGFSTSITGNTMKVKLKTKFFAAATGQFSVGVYLVEDGIVAEQNGQGANAVHPFTLRATNLPPLGAALTGSSFTANQTFESEVTINLDPSWNKNKLSVFTIVWKDGNKIVNANDIASSTTGINNVNTDVIGSTYPNPVTDQFSLVLKETVKDARVDLIDITGRHIATLHQGTITHGEVVSLTRPEGTAMGMYLLKISASGTSQVQKIAFK
jgi:hypothetical protein